MEYYDLTNLRLLAQGGEADIYDIGDNKVLRVLRDKNESMFGREKILLPILQNHHISVPKVYKYIEVDGKPAEVMQKITGLTMTQQLGHHPLEIVSEIKKLAHMQIDVSNVEADCKLTAIKDIINYYIKQPPLLKEHLIEFTLRIFKELSPKNFICHGDFHPGNIMIQDGKYYIIDWTGVYRSDFISDIAHSYLLMKCVPRVPGQSCIEFAKLKLVGAFIANVYLNEILRIKNFDMALFSKWTVVMSFLRVYYGLPSERAVRIDYIQKCYEMNERNINAAEWYCSI